MVGFFVALLSFVCMLMYLGMEYDTAKNNQFRKLSIIETDHRVLNTIFVSSTIFAIAIQSSNIERALYLALVAICTGLINLYLGYKSWTIESKGIYFIQSLLITSILLALSIIIYQL